MKPLILKPYLLLSAVLLLSSVCQAQFHLHKSKHTDTTGAAIQDSAAATGFGAGKLVKRKRILQVMPLRPYYFLAGKVRDTSRVALWIVVRDSVVKGVARYLDSGDSLRLFGTVEAGNKLVFCGFTADGNMKGCFTGRILYDSLFQGQWFALNSDTSWNCRLFSRDTMPPALDTSLVADRIEGTYSYHIGDLGAAGGIIIHQVAPGAISMDIGCAGPPPDYSSAMLKAPQVDFDGVTAIYRSPGKPNCQVRIRVFKDFVVINYVDKHTICGFGTSLEGVFARIK
jgi:hypothetical protein